MVVKIEQGIAIKGEEDIAKIKGRVERRVACFLLRGKKINPDLKIVYEPFIFDCHKKKGSREGTLPDFFVSPERPNSEGTFIEVTSKPGNGYSKRHVSNGNHNGEDGPCGNGNGSNDPKEKQKRVMQTRAPKTKYVVLYRENLKSIEAVLPDVNFFDNKKNGKRH